MKTFLFSLLLVLLPLISRAQKKETVFLWPGKVPGETKEKAEGVSVYTEKDNVVRFTEVTNPLMEIWLPEGSARKTGVIVCPGGGYRHLAYNKEGTEIAGWLNKNGYAAFVLQYRVPQKMEGALQDAQRAMRLIRQNAKKWNVDPEKIGMIGFSAGASLSARAATLYNKAAYSPVDAADNLPLRPAFALLIYPGLLDAGPDKSLTPELELTKNIPPLFMFQSCDDFVGNSSIVMALALRKAEIPFELHIVPAGGHGYGLRPGNPAAEAWPDLALKWMERID